MADTVSILTTFSRQQLRQWYRKNQKHLLMEWPEFNQTIKARKEAQEKKK